MIGTGTTLPQEDIAAFRDAGLRLVKEAGDVIARRLSDGFTARKKQDRSFVTEVDLEVEQLVRERISASFPDHGILGEEFGSLRPESPFRWIIDPIDGTFSLRNRIPLFGTILALLHQDEPIVGIINLPGIGRLYHAARGLGTYRNEERILIVDVQEEAEIEDEVISTGDRRQFVTAGQLGVFDTLMQRHTRVRTYADCFGHGLAAEGLVGAMVDFDLNLWDAAAAKVLVEEAGGMYVRMPSVDGRSHKYDIIFGKPRVVRWVLRELARPVLAEASDGQETT